MVPGNGKVRHSCRHKAHIDLHAQALGESGWEIKLFVAKRGRAGYAPEKYRSTPRLARMAPAEIVCCRRAKLAFSRLRSWA